MLWGWMGLCAAGSFALIASAKAAFIVSLSGRERGMCVVEGERSLPGVGMPVDLDCIGTENWRGLAGECDIGRAQPLLLLPPSRPSSLPIPDHSTRARRAPYHHHHIHRRFTASSHNGSYTTSPWYRTTYYGHLHRNNPPLILTTPHS